jgi:hypothetical protein
MQSPVRIEFQGMNPADAVQDKILRYVAELESRFGRVTAGHVVVKVPGEHPPHRRPLRDQHSVGFTRSQGGQCWPRPARGRAP